MKFKAWDQKRKLWMTDFITLSADGATFIDHHPVPNIKILPFTDTKDINQDEIYVGHRVSYWWGTRYEGDIVQEKGTFYIRYNEHGQHLLRAANELEIIGYAKEYTVRG